MFSSRVPADRQVNRLTAAVFAHRRSGRPLLDLTATNPTVVGLPYPADTMHALAAADGLTYRPEPLGLLAAREAIALDYVRRGISVAPPRIVVTASTSEAYSVLLKLLCESSGQEVLVPSPSYPLFDHLTRLDGVGSRVYQLAYHGRWELDVESVDTAWTDRIQAALVVSPNNPTGSTLTAAELRVMADRCASRDAALIVDEVFADYPHDEVPPDDRLDSGWSKSALTFRLGGLSKSAGLPQVKLGWIAVDGPGPLVDEALDRLGLVLDTYLSVSTPVQLAAPALIERGALIRSAIRERIRANLQRLREAAAEYPAVELLRSDGGWSAVIRVPARRAEEEMALDLLHEHDTLVHPGFFFDFAHEAFFVVSLLPEPRTFNTGVRRLLEHVNA
jgi:aspartate/methionine/tyrosine aminotransferase